MLSELPETELDNLCSILHKEWPQSIPAINFLRTCSQWKKKKPSLDIQILYNEKNIQSGIFILIYKSKKKDPEDKNVSTFEDNISKDENWCRIWLIMREQDGNIPILTTYALDSYENELEEILSHFLDKCEKILAPSSISKKHIRIVEKVIHANAYKIILRENYDVLSLNIDEAKKLKISYPVDVEVRPLEKKHLKDIREMTSQLVKYVFSLEEFENRLELNNEFALGIFCKITGRLLSRCMRSHNGEICSLQTIEEARRKGYAKLLLKLVSKKLAEISNVPYLITDVNNEKGMKVAQGAGFHKVSHMMYVVIEKSDVPA